MRHLLGEDLARPELSLQSLLLQADHLHSAVQPRSAYTVQQPTLPGSPYSEYPSRLATQSTVTRLTCTVLLSWPLASVLAWHQLAGPSPVSRRISAKGIV